MEVKESVMEETSMDPGLSWIEDQGVPDGPHASLMDRVFADIIDGLVVFEPAALSSSQVSVVKPTPCGVPTRCYCRATSSTWA